MNHFNKWYILAQELEKSGNLQRDVKESGYLQPGVCKINTKSIRQLSYFHFQWKKSVYQNNFKRIAFFFTLFKGYQCNKSQEITPTKRFLFEPEKKNFKRNEDFTCVFSILEKFEIYFLSLPLEIVFGVITDNLLHRQPLKSVKKNAIWLKYSGTRFFCPLKIRITH